MLPERRLDGHQVGLDFDDKERPGQRIPANQVDRTALAPLRVGGLGAHFPPELRQPRRNRADQPCVALVEDAVDLRAEPSDGDLQTRTEPARYGPDRAEAQVARSSELDGGHRRPADTGAPGEIHLSEAASAAHDPNQPAETEVVHRPTMTPTPFRVPTLEMAGAHGAMAGAHPRYAGRSRAMTCGTRIT